MEGDKGRQRVIAISIGGSKGGQSPSIEIHQGSGGGFQIHEFHGAKPPKIEMPRREPRQVFLHRLEPATIHYASPLQSLLLPHRSFAMPLRRVDPRSIEILQPNTQSRTIQIQKIDSSAGQGQSPRAVQSVPPPDVEMRGSGPRQFDMQQKEGPQSPDTSHVMPPLGVRQLHIQRSESSSTQSPDSSRVMSPLGVRQLQIQRSESSPPRDSPERVMSPLGVRQLQIQRSDGSPPQSPVSISVADSPGIRRIEIQRSGSPQSPGSPGADGIQFPRRLEIQRTESPLVRSDSPPLRSGSPNVEVHQFGPHTLEIKRGASSQRQGTVPSRTIEIQRPGGSPAKSRVLEIQRSDSPSNSPPGSPKVLDLREGPPIRAFPLLRPGSSVESSRLPPQGAEATEHHVEIPRAGSRVIQIQRSTSPHMQVHKIEPPHLEIQGHEPLSAENITRQGPMDVRWPSSRRVEIRGILGRGLRNRTLSFTIHGGKIEMGGLEGGKIFSLRAPKEDVAIIEREVKPSITRGEPDGEANTFLKQKEAQLREKREREKEKERQRERQQQEEKERLQQKEDEKEARLKAVEIAKPALKEPEPIVVIPHKEPETVTLTPVQKAKEKEVPVPAPIQPKPQPEPQPEPEPKPQLKPEVKVQKPEVKSKKSPLQDLSSRIPTFYFPQGKPAIPGEQDAVVEQVKDIFAKLEGGKAPKDSMSAIAKVCGISPYWKMGLFLAAGGEKSGHITLQTFLALWKKLSSTCHDDASRFIRLFSKPGCSYLVAEDFVLLIQDVVDTHPGLTFLQDAPEFHSRYVHTVISRIFYCVNRTWSGRITLPELRKSNFLQTLALLEEEEDINQVIDFFSYEHFYVIYCKFWELDKDHDLFINKDDLSRHNDHSISSRMIDRIFSGAVTRGRAQKDGKMSYTEFVWFLISEEDKKHLTSIEYWFRCMDLDGDGIISMYEMEYFYEEQVQRMESLGIETLPFEDCLCQMLDMVKPRLDGKVTLTDLKACKMTPLFFDTFFNLEKYLDHEQKDPFANVRDGDEPELSDWERYAAEEYEILVAEEGANDGQQEEIMYEDDFEPDDEDPTSGRTDLTLTDAKAKARARSTSPDDDIYDFSTGDLGY